MPESTPLYPNRDSAHKALDYYQKEMSPFVVRQLKKTHGGTVDDHIRNALSDRPGLELENFNRRLQESQGRTEKVLDINTLRTLIRKLWRETFAQTFKKHPHLRDTLDYITEVRNDLAHHGLEDMPSEDALRFIEEVLQVLNLLNATADSLEQTRRERYAVMERALNEYRQTQGQPALQETNPDIAALTAEIAAELKAENQDEQTEQAARLQAQQTETQEKIKYIDDFLTLNRQLLQLEASNAACNAALHERESLTAQYENAVGKHESAATALNKAVLTLSKAQSPTERQQAESQIETANEKAIATGAAAQAAGQARLPDLPPEKEQEAAEHAMIVNAAFSAMPELPELDSLEEAVKSRHALTAGTVNNLRPRKARLDRRWQQASQRHAEADEQIMTAKQELTAARNPSSNPKSLPPQPNANSSSLPAAEDDLFNENPSMLKEGPPLPADLPARWKQVLAQLNKRKGAQYNLGALLRDCRPDQITRDPDGALRLPFKNALNAERMAAELSAAPVREQVEAAVAAALGFPCELRIQPPPQ